MNLHVRWCQHDPHPMKRDHIMPIVCTIVSYFLDATDTRDTTDTRHRHQGHHRHQAQTLRTPQTPGTDTKDITDTRHRHQGYH